jgi:hypothetical protein
VVIRRDEMITSFLDNLLGSGGSAEHEKGYIDYFNKKKEKL